MIRALPSLRSTKTVGRVSGALVLTLGAAFVLSRFAVPGFLAIIGAMAFAGSALAILRNPLVGVFVITFFLPFERVGSVDAFGLTLRLSQLFGLLTLAGWGIGWMRMRSWRLQPQPLLVPIALFLLAAAWSVSQAVNPPRAVSVLFFIGFTIAVAFAITDLVRSRRTLERILLVLFLTTLLVCAYGVFQFIGDLAGLSPSVTGLRDLYTKEVFGFPRVQSTTLEPLYFANFLLLPLSVAVALFLGKERRHTLLLLLVIAAALLNIVLTLSRGGWIAAAASLFVIGVISLRRLFSFRRILFGSIVIAAVVGGVFAVFSYTQDAEFSLAVFQRQAGALFEGASFFDREATFRQAWELFLAHPWLGVGIGNFGPEVAIHPQTVPTGGWLIVNNELLEVLAETGLAGLVPFLLVIGVLVVRSLRALIVVRDPWLRSILLGLFAAFIGVLVQYQTFSTLYIMHVWVLVGLLVAAQNLAMKEFKM